MARIQIGEVLIETRENMAQAGPASPDLISLGERVPLSPLILWTLGGLIWALGTGVLLRGTAALYDFSNPIQFDLVFLLMGLPLASLGATLAGLGILKHKAAKSDDAPAKLIEGPVDEAQLEKNRKHLESALSSKNAEATVEALAGDHGLSVEEVVWTLGVLCDRNIVSEELNVDSGEWYYQLQDQPTAPELDEIPDAVSDSRPLTLEERLKKQDGDNR